MSINSEISRLQTAKSDMKAAIESKNVSVPSSTKIDGYADLISQISVESSIDTIIINQSISDPATMVSGDINGNVIKEIRANSHCYLGKYTSSGTMTICQLSDTNKAKYHDGSDAILTGSQGDVFMKLPTFYYKVENGDENIIRISLCIKNKPNSSWQTWDGNRLVGVYHAYLSSNKLYSYSGITPLYNLYQTNLKTYARNRGTGFHLVTWEWFCIMIPLYLFTYGHMDSQVMCGRGDGTCGKTTGSLNSLGMTDTSSSSGTYDVNFWGLEGWFGNGLDFVDNVISTSGGIVNILDLNGNMIRSFSNDGHSYDKRTISQYLDIFPIGYGSGSNKTGWCSFMESPRGNSGRALRFGAGGFTIGASNSWDGGVSCFFMDKVASSTSSAATTTRLAFTGSIVEQSNVSTFKSLTQIG